MKKLLTIVAISALTLSTLAGCGKKDEPTVVEPTATVEATVEPTETVESTSSNTVDTTVEISDEITDETPEIAEVDPAEEAVVIDLPANEYYVDYPMTFEDTTVCIKINDNIHFNADIPFYPNEATTAADYFNETGIMRCSLTDKYLFQPKIIYSLNPVETVEYYRADSEYYNVSEITDYTNTIYVITDNDYFTNLMIIEYTVNDTILQVTIEDNNNKLTDAEKKMLFEYFGENIPFEIIK